ncbi:MAG: BrnT family toxin [Allosphingosinicella sp.]
MEWTWDADKARQNVEKHGVSFEAASLVFHDPMLISEPDPHSDEDRWRVIGRVQMTTLFVVHTVIEADGTGRIISARRATPSERKRYEAGLS